MAEFQAITTQEELNRIIEDRLGRERAKYAKFDEYKADSEAYQAIKGKDYEKQISDLNGDLAKKSKDLSDVTKRAEQAERSLLRSKVAREEGLPWELADRLQGEDEKALREDAKALAKFAGTSMEPQPLADLDDPGKGGKDADMLKLLQDLKGE